MALCTYGLLFLLYVLAGLRGAQQTGQVRAGVRVAVWSGMISSLIAFNFALLLNYFFMDKFLQHPLLYDDFIRSGMSDLTAFTIQDTLGGGGAHLLLLGIVLAAALGAVGGLLAKGYARLRAPGRAANAR